VYTGDSYRRSTLADFLSELEKKEDKQHWFKPRGGSGNSSKGAGNPSPVTGGKNPFDRGNFNLTEQMRIYKENPALYQQLKASAAK
jgi:hypothetical protein